ncbi:MAG: TonB-dependent receptor [Calditrichaeota bacterium]|nr:MAG: TonB-dependent receptor [Calditrichota bacterium]
MRILTALLAGIILTFFSPADPAFSQSQINPDELFNMSMEDLMKVQVKVSSTKPATLFNTPSSVTILDKEMLQRYHFQDIAEAVRSVAGMEVYQTIMDRNVATSRGILQNFYANKILLMVNQIPTWQPIYGEGYLERFDIHDIERIEILKGPASVLYGSNAYTGVINLVLKEVKKTAAGTKVQIGAPHINSSSTRVHFQKEDFKLSFAVNNSSERRNPYQMRSARDHPYAADSVFLFQEGYQNNNFTLNVNHQSHSLLVNYFQNMHTFLGVHPSFSTGAGTKMINQGSLLNYRYTRQVKGKTRLRSNFTFDSFERSFPVTADRDSIIRLAGDRISGDLNLNYKAAKNIKFEMGAVIETRRSHGHDTRDALQDTLIRHNLVKDADVHEGSIFSQVYFDYRKLNILLGSRYTHNNNFGRNISSRVTSVFKLNKKNSFKLIWGQSFRVPTMFELYFDHETVVGSRDLKPETSTSHEFAYLTSFNNFFFQALGFYGEYENLIQRIKPDKNLPSQYINIEKIEGYGAELELKYDNPGVCDLFLNYSYVQNVDNKTDNNYRYVPDHIIDLGLSRRFGQGYVSLVSKAVSKVEGNLDIIDPQFILDGHVGFAHEAGLLQIRHTLSIKNINDSDMLIAEYIRQTPNINSIPTTGFGRRVIYSAHIGYRQGVF